VALPNNAHIEGNEVYDILPTAMTETKQGGYYDVSFSPGAGSYLLSYKGPDVPYQRLIEAREDGGSFES